MRFKNLSKKFKQIIPSITICIVSTFIMALTETARCQKVEYGFLGIETKELDRQTAKKANLSAAQGVVVKRVLDNSPAKIAGIESGDIIIKIDGERIKNILWLQKIVAGIASGKKVEIEMIREREKKSLIAKIEKMSERIKLSYLSKRKERIEERITLDWAGIFVGCGVGLGPGIVLLMREKKLDWFGKTLAYTFTIGGSVLSGICLVDLPEKRVELRKTQEEINQIQIKTPFSFIYIPADSKIQLTCQMRF